jgi:hypothetical protein
MNRLHFSYFTCAPAANERCGSNGFPYLISNFKACASQPVESNHRTQNCLARRAVRRRSKWRAPPQSTRTFLASRPDDAPLRTASTFGFLIAGPLSLQLISLICAAAKV